MSNIYHSDGGYVNEINPLSIKILSTAVPLDTKSAPWSSWTLFDTQSALLSTVTSAGVLGKSHYVTCIVVSYSDLVQIGGITIKDNGVTIVDVDIKGSEIISLPTPIKISEGNPLSIELKAGSAGIVGKLSVVGFTV